MVIAQIPVESIAIFGTLERVRQENVLESVVVVVSDRDRIPNGKQPLRDVLHPRIHFLQDVAHLRANAGDPRGRGFERKTSLHGDLRGKHFSIGWAPSYAQNSDGG